jgi:hypothetical protein
MIGFAGNFLVSYCHCSEDNGYPYAIALKRKKYIAASFLQIAKRKDKRYQFQVVRNRMELHAVHHYFFDICQQEPRSSKFFNQITFERLAMQRQAGSLFILIKT